MSVCERDAQLSLTLQFLETAKDKSGCKSLSLFTPALIFAESALQISNLEPLNGNRINILSIADLITIIESMPYFDLHK